MYRFKQFEKIWYNHFKEYFLRETCENNPIKPFFFIKRSKFGFTVIVVYVNDLNIIENFEELEKIATYLKNEFEMKDLKTTNFCIKL